MSKAVPMRATLAPRLPSPRMPSVLPSRSKPSVVCQPPPGRIVLNSSRRWRASPSISAKASSAVALPAPPVLHTITSRALAASRSIEGIALARGHQQLEVGQLLEQGAVERGALAHDADHVELGERTRCALRVGQALGEDDDAACLLQPRPVGHAQRHVLVVVEDGDGGHGRFPDVILRHHTRRLG